MTDTHQEAHVRIGGLLKEAVFGYSDGVVSTFAVIAGLNGGSVEHKTVLLAALATLCAGAFSMGLGTYLGSKSERDLYESELAREWHEVETVPELERQEIRDIYAAKGFKGKLLEDVVAQITSDKEVWIKTMMQQELGFAEAPPKPGLNGIIMATSFVIGSAIATIPYLFPPKIMPQAFFFSLIAAVVGLLVAGAIKSRYTGKNAFISAMETLLIGALAAGGSYGIGLLFS